MLILLLKQLIIVGVICCSISFAKAQSLETLQKDKDITWIGEVTTDYCLHVDWYEKGGRDFLKKIGIEEKNVLKLLKLQATNSDYVDKESHFRLAFKTIKSKPSLKKYKDANLSQELSSEEYQEAIRTVDTIITFGDFRDIEQVVIDDLYSEDILSLKLKQLIYYNQKSMQFSAIPLAIAPVIKYSIGYINQKQDTIIHKQTKFWVKVDQLDKILNLDNKNISWAKRTYRNIPLNKIKVLKGDANYAILMDNFLHQLLKHKNKVQVRNTFDLDGGELLTAQEIQDLLVRSDTIFAARLDDWDNPGPIPVVYDSLNGQDIKAIRLAQNWVWDEEEQTIKIRCIQFSPIIYRFDDNDNFLNKGPLFHKKEADLNQ
jgi:hypothetical protein